VLSAFFPPVIVLIVFFKNSIAVPPRDSPWINSPKTVYRIGEEFTANCSSYPSRPPATITWTISDKPVNTFFIAFSEISLEIKSIRIGYQFKMLFWLLLRTG